MSGTALLVLEDFLLCDGLGDLMLGLAVPAEGFGLTVGGFADERGEADFTRAATGAVSGEGGEVAGVPGSGLLGSSGVIARRSAHDGLG
ncbi:hypothetical protein [Streptomyces sp. NPDC056061]|uniref:hypothetical protein n=1 Tax=Streptomyces sp. NPDC056061 TaxID=3345700 RepID=UPI0035DA8046